MKHIVGYVLVICFGLVPMVSTAQVPDLIWGEPTGEPDVYYYPFYNGIQMVEFDHLTAYHRRVNFLEQSQPRALSWDMVLGPPPPNGYIFRNEQGEVVQQYGMADASGLLSVQACREFIVPHSSLRARYGERVGFSSITTRYYPYYLIGYQSDVVSESLGLIDSLGQIVLPESYSVIWSHHDLFITRKGEVNELRDIHLSVLFRSEEYHLQPCQDAVDQVDVIKGEKCGRMDARGHIVIPCEYDLLIGQSNKWGLTEVRKQGLVGYVDESGKEVIPCKYQSAGDFSEDVVNVRLNNKWGYIEASGRQVIPHAYDIGLEFTEGLARVAIREGSAYYFGFIDKKGKVVIPLIYTDAKDFQGGVAEVLLDGKWIFINQKGQRL
jgi:hypothetical protein